MDLITALKEIAEQQGPEGWNVRSYSGRGMFGKPCVGIDVPGHREIGVVFFELGQKNQDVRDSDLDHRIFDYRTDNMGDAMIIYWPQIPYVEPEEPEVEEDEETRPG